MNHERLNLKKESEIWKAFLQGNERAYALIYRSYFSKLYDYGKRFTEDNGMIEDAIQLLFTQLWKNRKNLNPTASVQNYLYKSFRRKIVRIMQQKEKRMEGPLLENYERETTQSPEWQLIQDQDVQQVNGQLQSAFAQLPKRQREAIYLKYYERLSCEEVALIMDIEVHVVYNLVYKGLKKLKKILFIRKSMAIKTAVLLILILFFFIFQ